MSKCKVTLTANCGVMIECNEKKVFCDAFHGDKTDEFSTVTPGMQQHMINSPDFQNPDMIFFTHKHRDHYTRLLAEQAQELAPNALMVSPMAELDNQLFLHEDTHKISLDNAEFSFKHLRHDGKKYVNLPNYGCLMNLDGYNVLTLGDCVVCNPQLKDWIEGQPVDLALLNFPWLTLKRGRDFIADVIKPKQALFYHLPFAQDDINGYRDAAAKNLPLLDTPHDALLLQEPFQVATLD